MITLPYPEHTLIPAHLGCPEGPERIEICPFRVAEEIAREEIRIANLGFTMLVYLHA